MILEKILLLILSCLNPIIGNFIRLIPKLNQRVMFELKNQSSRYSESFHHKGIQADYCFEISSEGELEQIRYPLLDLLKNNKNIELIFCSESVERNCEKLASEFNNLRIYRLPLATFSWFFGQSVKKWMTAKHFILCRYDFFPELMILAHQYKSELWEASLLSKTQIGFWQKRYLNVFDSIFTSTIDDENRLKEIFKNKEIHFLEMRFLSIYERQKLSSRLIQEKVCGGYFDFLKKTKMKKIILGNFWLNEIELFQTELINQIKKEEWHISLFPHDLTQDNVIQIQRQLDHFGLKWQIVDDGVDFVYQPQTVCIILKRGILVEAYTYFNWAYVGGGFGRSVHSVLEPFLANCEICLGPKTKRSSEYLIASQEVTVLQNLTQLSNLILNNDKKRSQTIQKLIETTYTHYTNLRGRLI